MTASTTAYVTTTHGSRYLQQLCKHWSHKFTVDFTPENGTIEIPGGLTTLTAGEAVLEVRIDSPDVETRDRMKGVVAEHLDRFAFREAPLPFDWQDDA